jgi:hypothetical protein
MLTTVLNGRSDLARSAPSFTINKVQVRECGPEGWLYGKQRVGFLLTINQQSIF